jgi:hypothetical protein
MADRDEVIPINEVPDVIRTETNGAVNRSLDTIRDWCRKGQLKSRLIGGRRFVLRDSITHLIEGNH